MNNSNAEGRTIKRLTLQIPTRVQGKESIDKSWEEITKLKDVSASGACFSLRHKVESGNLINLTLPMPMQFRCYDHFSPQYHVWALIRHVIFQPDNETFSVGAAFIGKRPPNSYQNNPQTFYQLAEHSTDGFWYLTEKKGVTEKQPQGTFVKDKRKLERHKIPLTIFLQKSDQFGQTSFGEPSVTEDISTDGACVLTSLSLKEGDFVRFTCEQFNVSILSMIRGKHIGNDNISRLHIEFIDQKFPLDKM